MQTILEAVGNTPLVKLDKIARAANLKCNLCKFNNHNLETVLSSHSPQLIYAIFINPKQTASVNFSVRVDQSKIA